MPVTTGHRLVPLLALLLIGAAGRDLPLVDAARNADKEAVRSLLRKGANVTAVEGDGTTALHWASHRDDVEIADLLIQAGAKVNAANDLGATPLWTASQNGSASMVRSLLQAGADPNLSLILGETPVMVAARSGSPDVVEQLLAKGANANARGPRGQTALMWAAAQKHPDVVKVLLAHGADVQARSEAWSQVMAVFPHGNLDYNRAIPHGADTALMFAVREGDLSSAQLLVAAGASVNDADAGGVSATTLAAHAGFGDLVDFLLANGADPNIAAAGFSPLHIAVVRRDEKMVTALLARGADPNARLLNWTPTRRSSKDFNFEPPLVGATPYWLAARFGEARIMRLLLKQGADPRFVHHAAFHAGDPAEPATQVATALLAATGVGGGAAWVRPARTEREPRMLEAVKAAIEGGVDLNATDVDGRTALDVVINLGYDEVTAFLVEKGAKAETSGGPAETLPAVVRPAAPRR